MMTEVFIAKIRNTILSNLQNEKFGVSDLASEMGFSRSQVLRKVKAATGKSVNQFIREIRLEESIKLIKTSDLNSSEIAYQVGFSSPSYFNKCFLDEYGLTPGEYKNKIEEQGIPESKDIINQEVKKTNYTSIGILTAVLLMVITAVIMVFNSNLFNKQKKQRSIAILPLENYSEGNDKDYIADGITEAITLELARNKSIRVISRGSAMMYKAKNKLYADIAKELGVDLLIEGSVLYDKDSLSVIVQLIEPLPVEKHLWANNYDQKSTNILQVVRKISSEIAQEINLVVTPQEDYNAEYSIDPKAYDLYLKGRHIYNNQRTRYNSMLTAVDYLNQSIQQDPDFALAYVTLAEAYIAINTLLGNNEERLKHRDLARDAIKKAFEIDESLPEAFITKGHIAGKFDWQWDQMKELAEKGLELDPNNAQAHVLLSNYYVIKGNYDKAIKEASIAETLDPLNPSIGCLLGERYYIAGKFKLALDKYNEVIEMFPNYGFALHLAGYAYLQLGEVKKAVESWHDLQLIMENDAFANCYETSDLKDCLRFYLKEAKKLSPKYCTNPVIVSSVHTMVNELDGALQYLKVAFEYKSEDLAVMIAYPDFKPLYQNPEFIKLAEKVGAKLDTPGTSNP